METLTRARPFEYGAVESAHAGEAESGDRHVVVDFDDGALVAMIDALGHGPEAALAAEIAAGVLEESPQDSLRMLVERCHDAMRGTRGAAMSLASFNWRQGSLTWMGVGNVAGALVFADEQARPRVQLLLMRGGVVGDRLPELRPLVMPVSPGDSLVLATDGVRDEFSESLPAGGAPRALAQQIFDRYARRDDDAAVLVLRVGGER
jgi:serine phosphatase RsbU (regulator of sigma subunit)